jgi:hypothetical protein
MLPSHFNYIWKARCACCWRAKKEKQKCLYYRKWRLFFPVDREYLQSDAIMVQMNWRFVSSRNMNTRLGEALSPMLHWVQQYIVQVVMTSSSKRRKEPCVCVTESLRWLLLWHHARRCIRTCRWRQSNRKSPISSLSLQSPPPPCIPPFYHPNKSPPGTPSSFQSTATKRFSCLLIINVRIIYHVSLLP